MGAHVPTLPAPPTVTPTPSVIVNKEVIDVRTGPGTEYPSIAKLAPATPISIIARNPESTWYQVCCVNGVTVWLEAQAVQVHNDINGIWLVKADASPPAPTPTIALTGITTAIPVSIAGSVTTPLPTSSGQQPNSPLVTPDLPLSVSLSNKGTPTVENINYNALIQNAVRATLTAIVASNTPLPTNTPTPFISAKNNLSDLRTGPGVAYPLISKLGLNIPVPIIGKNQEGGWLQLCCVSGATVWVSITDVTVTNAISAVAWVNVEPPPPPTPTPLTTPTPKASSP